MIIRPILISVLTIFICAESSAAECFKKGSIKKENFKIRDSFDGGKKENQGARLALSSPAGEDTMTIADIGIKMVGCTTDDGFIEFVPYLEYHNDQSLKKPVESYSVGTKVEFTPKKRLMGGYYQPFFDLDLKYKDDKEGDKESGAASLLIYGEGFDEFTSFKPLALIGGYSEPLSGGFGDVWLITPYIGLEKYKGIFAIVGGEIQETETVDPAYALFRYYVEVWPYRAKDGRGIQVVATTALRTKISGDGVDTPNFSSLDINYVFDKDGNVALGLGYTSGDNPENSFFDEEKTTLSLKVKY